MRKSKEWSAPLGKKPAVFAVDVAEVPNLPTAPSSSTSPNSKGDVSLDQGAVVVQKSLSVQPSNNYRSDSNPSTHVGSVVVSETGSNVPAAPEPEAPSELSEGTPHSAWYRIIYKVGLKFRSRQVAGLHRWWLSCSIMQNRIAGTPTNEYVLFYYFSQGGIRLRRTCSMHDTLEGTLPVGCFVKTSRRVVSRSWPKSKGDAAGCTAVVDRSVEKDGQSSDPREEAKKGGDTTVFLQLLACVGAKVRVADAWIFESITHAADTDTGAEASVLIAAEKVDEPKVESQPGLVLMVLYPGGITLRASPHMSAAKVDYIVKMYECHSAQGMISTADGMESYALLGGGAWLPCKAPGGLEVAVRVPRMPSSREGFFEVTMREDCQTLYGPFPDTPSLPHVLPKGIVLQFDVLMWYPSIDGSVSASDIFLRLQQSESDVPAPAIWVRRDDDVLSIAERSQNP
jgi:hypothetical protein